MKRGEISEVKKDPMLHLIKKENLKIKINFLKKITLDNQVLKIRKNFLKKMTLEKQVLKIRKNLMDILIIQNISINR